MFNILKKNKLKKNFLETIREIQCGNVVKRNEFISNYEPFILKCVSQVLNYRFVDKKNNDEYSIGLIAFNEAIDKFDENKNKNFLEFAQLVISRRVINYRVKESNRNNEYLGGDMIESTEKLNSYNNYSNNTEQVELLDFKNKLKQFNMSIVDLADNVPKRRDSKKFCISVAKSVVNNERIFREFEIKKVLPIGYIIEKHSCSKRTIERNRKFIIASILILSSNLDIIKEFLDNSN